MAKSFLSGQSKKKKSDKKLPWKQISIVVGVLVVAFAAGVITFFVQQKGSEQKKTAEQTSPQTNLGNYNQKPEGAVEESAAKAAKGDYNGAQKQLDQALKDAKDNQQAHDLLLQKAINAFNKKDYAGALEFSKQAIAKVNDYQANLLAAQTAEVAGQKAAAKGYYQVALEKLDKSIPNYDDEKKRLEGDIKRVSQ